MESRLTALGGVGGWGEGTEQKRKRFYGHGQCCGDGGWGKVEECIRG